MNDRTATRTARFAAHQSDRQAATRQVLAWFGVAAAGVVLAALAANPAAAAQPDGKPEAMMVRGGVLAANEAAALPRGNWYRVINKPGHLHVQAVDVPANEDAEVGRLEGIDTVYVRLPAVAVTEGRVPAVQVDANDGAAGPSHTLVADLDADGKPDFLVRAGREDFLLLSSRAQAAAAGGVEVAGQAAR